MSQILRLLVATVALQGAATGMALAADAAPAPDATSTSTQTDVVGSKEAPSVFNIVPWKDKGLTLPKRAVNTSILRETLQPLDRDVLRREVQLQQTLARE